MDRRHFLHAVNVFGVGTVMPTLPCSEYRVGIVAVGGAGGNVLNDLAGCLPRRCRTVAINTQSSSFHRLIADRRISIDGTPSQFVMSDDSRRLTVQRRAQSAVGEIADAVNGLNLVALVAGMGGVAGTEISPIAAQVLRHQNICTVGIPIMPFHFEGERRSDIAREGAAKLGRHVHSLIPISNETFAQAAGENASMADVFNQVSLAVLKHYQWVTRPIEASRLAVANHSLALTSCACNV